jgi:hypothetical protein
MFDPRSAERIGGHATDLGVDLRDELQWSLVRSRCSANPRSRAVAELAEVPLEAWGRDHAQQSGGALRGVANGCGALAGTFTVSPARAFDLAPRKVTSISPSRTWNISSKS